MAVMIVKTEVEATPELVISNLTKFAAQSKDKAFPYSKGSFVNLKPEYLTAVGGISGLPAMVIMSGLGTELALVAINKADGDVTLTLITTLQVEGVYVANP